MNKKRMALFLFMVSVVMVGAVFAQTTMSKGIILRAVKSGTNVSVEVENPLTQRAQVEFSFTLTSLVPGEVKTQEVKGKITVGAKKTETYKGGSTRGVYSGLISDLTITKVTFN